MEAVLGKVKARSGPLAEGLGRLGLRRIPTALTRKGGFSKIVDLNLRWKSHKL